MKVSIWWMGRERDVAMGFIGTIGGSVSGRGYTMGGCRNKPSWIFFRPRPTRLSGRQMTSILAIFSGFACCSLCNARREYTLKASAPQKSIRRGSCCFVAVLEHRMPSHLLLDAINVGLKRCGRRSGILWALVMVRRSEVEWICTTLIGQMRASCRILGL